MDLLISSEEWPKWAISFECYQSTLPTPFRTHYLYSEETVNLLGGGQMFDNRPVSDSYIGT